MERKTLARWLVVAALACFGLGMAASAASADSTIQGSQTSDAASAETGSASGTNQSSFNGGPTSVGSSGANSGQLGSNRATVSQTGSAKSGDPVAGAQVTGAVADNVTVQNQNNAVDPSAISGFVNVSNTTGEEGGLLDIGGVTVGPAAFTDGGTAQTSQVGDNSLELSQAADGTTGDAVAGSQVTGIVGGGEHTVQNQNTSFCSLAPCAFSGEELIVENAAATAVGPLAGSFDITAQAGQIGDNDAVISQSASGHSGDAVNGSQVTGVVGGSATVQNQNNSFGSGGDAESGPVGVHNALGTFNGFFAVAGPQSSAPGSAQATQNGDNAVDVSQVLDASSGDALSGSQVTGLVGDEGGFATVQNQQASEGDEAISGEVDAANDIAEEGFVAVGTDIDIASLSAGPNASAEGAANASQIGDNAVALAQDATLATGDALAGAQVTGDVGHNEVTIQEQNDAVTPSAIAGNIEDTFGFMDNGVNFIAETSAGPAAFGDTGNASQVGDNAVSVDQVADLSTGDAVAGAQVTGVVAGGANPVVTIQNQNNAEAASANGSGDGANIFVVGDVAVNRVTISAVGPDAEGSTSAQASQSGDNAAAVNQAADVTTGDAVAGAQITGVVAGDGADVTVQNQNTDDAGLSEIGSIFIDFVNDIAGADFGPEAIADVAQASQNGDNAVSFDQVANLATGDGVAGAQVTGVVAGDGSTIDIQEQNFCVLCAVEGGDIEVNSVNIDTAPVFEGPGAEGFDSASASQIGGNTLDWTQVANVSTGDAVAGSQVTGAVAGDGSEVTVQNSNRADSPTAFSGTYDASAGEEPINSARDTAVGPIAVADGTALATQNGDNAVAFDQTFSLTSGDAVGGSQVTGVVSGDNSEVTVQVQNDANGALVESGDLDAGVGNEIGNTDVDPADQNFVGPVADAFDSASASQIGDNAVAASQAGSAVSGDAVAGGQISGVVTGDSSITTVQGQNHSFENSAESGDVFDPGFFNFIALNAGPEALTDGSAQASQVGDNAVAVAQAGVAQSGDAVAGGQVTGAVTGSGSEITVQNQNSSEADLAISGLVGAELDGLVGNAAIVDAGVEALGTTAQATQNGDNGVDFAQDMQMGSGDAVTGAQVTGFVGGDGLDATVQNQNDATVVEAVIGFVGVVAGNVAAVDVATQAYGDTSASSSQLGDNAVAAGQNLEMTSGDAVAGAQVTGGVGGDNSDITVQNSNTASEVLANLESGAVLIGENTNFFGTFDSAAIGPFASTEFGSGAAQATQGGDNAVDVAQAATLATGDAVGGAQVTGLVDGANSTNVVQNTNTCAFDACATVQSGSIEVLDGLGNEVFVPVVGPASLAGDGSASSSQIGDNDVAVGQTIDASTGDAVGGAQVTGVVAGGGSDTTVQNTNSANTAEAISGFVLGLSNTMEVDSIGPAADAFGGTASASQIGDDNLDFAQDLSVASGDAVAGAQVTGTVGGEATTQVSNSDIASFALSGDTDALNTAIAALGPSAISDLDALVSLTGDTGFDAAQGLAQSSGDAVAGAQIGGHVA